ncbi:PQQ-binding-like beta-propeller repeat protein [Treponema brennaborense]|uniref:Pyrrolo-quinoline quinone repeat domain-containing protein n=1 Tax=Treponema brennaborense (strain DSM 12168 / CIP 105900 / DD5/3) TaxID=906968 RepID=F4LNU3_TREBD|nr:PQQ-binding-like beta-propeller repeat protein [Treponema brennaborense]AEE16928.1 hypothetical protein Trebr_1505 [Treponema brennaborense DSM 12168]
MKPNVPQLAALVLLLTGAVYAAQQQPAAVPGWQLVSGGSAVAQPVKTDYGFAVLLEGRAIAAATADGTLLWEKSLPGKPEPFLGVGSGNFLYAVTDRRFLSAYNPSGLRLWTVQLPSDIVSAPLQGRDGRIFVQCADGVGCYGVTGVQKWFVQAGEPAEFPLYELEDGSLLHIQRKTVSGGSTALRLSPFGAVIEEITFTGRIRSAACSPYGVILVFDDGSTGCCSSPDNAAETRWMLQPDAVVPDGSAVLLVDEKNGTGCYISAAGSAAAGSPAIGSANCAFVDLRTGTIKNRIIGIPVNANRLTCAQFSDKTLVLCDTDTAAAYEETGRNLWQTQIPSRSPWAYLLYLDNGYLTVFEKNTWITSAYRMVQTVGAPSAATGKKTPATPAYPIYTETVPTAAYGKRIDENTYRTMRASLQTGNYGTAEAQWIPLVAAEIHQLRSRFTKRNGNSRQDVTIFDTDAVYAENVVTLAGTFGTRTFTADIAALLTTETDGSMISAVLHAAAQTAYDPDGAMLNAILQLIHKKTTVTNRRVAKDACDAVYEICRFMGKPALFSKGIDILRYFFYPQFDREIKEYASETMQKIISLQM